MSFARALFYLRSTLTRDWTNHRVGSQLKNVWTSDKSWEPGSFLMFSYVFQCFLTFSIVTYSHSHSHSLSLSHSLTLSHSFSLSHSFNLSLNHSWHAEQLLFSSLCSKLTLTLSHSLTLTLSHSHTLSISHSITLDMLNKFCFHLYAQNSLFIGENCNVFFGPQPQPHPIPWH